MRKEKGVEQLRPVQGGNGRKWERKLGEVTESDTTESDTTEPLNIHTRLSVF